MAYTSNIAAREKGIFSDLLSRIGAYFVAYMETQSRAQAVERLNALSDEQLAARGLTRDRIVQHVFRDRFCF